MTDDNSRPRDSDGLRERVRASVPDVRGQTEVLGAILVFGLLIALLVLIQVGAVPGWNQQLEYEHNLRVHDDVKDMKGAAEAVAGEGSERSVVVETGVRYPPRPFLFNPPPSPGVLETTGQQTIRFENSRLLYVDNYWNGSQPFSTTGVRYVPAYNQYQTAPTTFLEYGYVYNRFENTDNGSTVVRPVGETNLVNGDRINVVLYEGQFSTSSPEATTVNLNPVSAPTQSVPLQSRTEGDDVVIQLPTLADEDAWRETLDDELDPGGNSPSRYVKGLDVTNNVLTLRLEPTSGNDSYDLRMAKVGLTNRARPSEPHYITAEEDPESIVTTENTARQLSVQVRDQYNNPKANVPVDFEVVEGVGSVTPLTDTSGDDGRATTTLIASQSGYSIVEAEADLNDDGTITANETERFNVSVRLAGSNVTIIGDPLTLNPGVGSELVQLTQIEEDEPTGDIYLTFNNEAGQSLKMDQIRIPFYYDSNKNEPPASVTFNYLPNNESLDAPIPGNYQEFNGPTLTRDGTEDEEAVVRVTKPQSQVNGDFFVMSVIYREDDGDQISVTYFVGIPS